MIGSKFQRWKSCLPIHDNCRLLCLLLMHFGGLYCKYHGPRSDCSLRSSLIRVHSVCLSGVHLNICSRGNMQMLYSGQKIYNRIRVKIIVGNNPREITNIGCYSINHVWSLFFHKKYSCLIYNVPGTICKRLKS